MSNRRKLRPAQVWEIPVDPEDVEAARAVLNAVTACATCGGHARTGREGGLVVYHDDDCPARKKPSLTFGPSGS
jgi:hypothetical protein